MSDSGARSGARVFPDSPPPGAESDAGNPNKADYGKQFQLAEIVGKRLESKEFSKEKLAEINNALHILASNGLLEEVTDAVGVIRKDVERDVQQYKLDHGAPTGVDNNAAQSGV